MYKYASAVTDAGGKYLTSAIPYVNVANPVGTVAGLLEEPGGKSVLNSMNNDKEGEWKSFIPGVGAYRTTKRLSNVHKAFGSDSPRQKTINQMLGPATQALLSMIGGAVIGGYIGNKYSDPHDQFERRGATAAGAMAGATMGLGASGLVNITTALAAAISDTRTDEEQEEATNQSSVKNYLIPGYGVYDYYKTLGKSNKM